MLDEGHIIKNGKTKVLGPLKFQYNSSRIQKFHDCMISFLAGKSYQATEGKPSTYSFRNAYPGTGIYFFFTPTFFCNITVRRSKYCLEISKALERLKLS